MITLEQHRLARSRLWLGIANVGFWVFAASGGLFLLLVFGFDGLGAGRWLLLGALIVAVQGLFDFVGGALLMPGMRPSAGGFSRGWARGVAGHSVVMLGFTLLSYVSFRFSGGFGLAIVLGSTGLALGRRFLAKAIGGVLVRVGTLDGRAILYGSTTDPSFTGGIVGLGRSAMSLEPASWPGSLPPGELAAEASRRKWQIEEGLAGRSFFLILSWNLLGTYAGSLACGLATRPPGDALFGHACWMTLWTFGGLLILPLLSRTAVLAADRAALDAGYDPRGWITLFPGLVGEEGGPNAAVEAIFYPIPSAARRLRALDQSVPRFVPGNLARNNLYYSWATLTFLGRCVHCNVGRPALWVFPPTA